jgi:hypothetical protein
MSQFKFDPIDKIEKEAASYNCEVVIAKDNELQFDLDTYEAVAYFSKFVQGTLSNRFKQTFIFPRRWQSKNGHDHAVITLPYGVNLSVPERIALQLAGGSDPKREFAALCCHWDGSPHPILLFKPKPKMVAPSASFFYETPRKL